MTLASPRTFERIGRALSAGPATDRPHLTVHTGTPLRLSPADCRKALYGPHRDEALWPVIWRQAVMDAQDEPRDGRGVRTLLVVWLTVPGLNRHLYRITGHWRVERSDLEAEAAVGVLTALDAATPDAPNLGGRLISAGVGRMWKYAVRARKEIPVVDLGRFTRTRNVLLPPPSPSSLPPVRQGRTGPWELHIAPPPGDAGLSATLRFTEAGRRVEGERLGALTHHLGLPELAFRARRHQEARLVGRLALRPSGGPR